METTKTSAVDSAPVVIEDQDAREPDETWAEDVASLCLTPPPRPIHLHKSYQNQSLVVSWTALSSWVRQPSPCCCAAALAGAFNACHGGRGSPDAIDTKKTLELLKQMLMERMAGVRESVARQLGINLVSVVDFEAQFAQELILRCPGRSVGGKGDKGIGSKEGEAILYDFISRAKREREGHQGGSSDEGSNDQPDICSLLHDLLPPPPPSVPEGIMKDKGEGGGGVEEAEEDNEDPSISTNPQRKKGVAIEIPAFTGKRKKKSIKPPKGLKAAGINSSNNNMNPGEELLDDLIDLLIGKPWGLEQISRPRPSTAAFGTWAILQGIERLGLKATIVMQRGSKPQLGSSSAATEVSFIADDDDEDRQDRQWSALSRELMREKSALVFHLTNHYAFIYAMRERVEEGGEQGEGDGEGGGGRGLRRVREVLTARRGQRPTAWVSFKECRRVMMSWSQYCIIRVENI